MVIVFLSVSASLPTWTNAPKLLPDHNGTVSLNGRVDVQRVTLRQHFKQNSA